MAVSLNSRLEGVTEEEKDTGTGALMPTSVAPSPAKRREKGARGAREREAGDRERGKIGYEPFSLHAAPYTGLSWGVGSSGLPVNPQRRNQAQIQTQ